MSRGAGARPSSSWMRFGGGDGGGGGAVVFFEGDGDGAEEFVGAGVTTGAGVAGAGVAGDDMTTGFAVRPEPKFTVGRLSPISPALPPREVESKPSPSCPSLFLPQHFTVASSRVAHVVCAPHATSLAVRPVPRST